MIRTYARIVGVLLICVGLAGIVGLIDTVRPADLFHVGVGSIFAYLGFLQRDTTVIREVVGGIGVLLLLAKGSIILLPLLWGEAIYYGPIEVTCVVAGLLSITAARYLRDGQRRGGEP